MLCVLLQHCSESQEKKYIPSSFQKELQKYLLLTDTGLAERDLAHLTALLPTMGKLQPQDPRICIPGTWLCYSCSQRRGCNAAVNPVCGLHQENQKHQPSAYLPGQPQGYHPSAVKSYLLWVCTDLRVTTSLSHIITWAFLLTRSNSWLQDLTKSPKTQIIQIWMLLSTCLALLYACRILPLARSKPASIYLISLLRR